MLFVSMIVAATLATSASPGQRHDCKPIEPEPATAALRAGFHKLGELPPANHVLALFRTIDSCPAPVVVRYGIGTVDRPVR
ncbi:hypothetical protein KX816_05810 [Sphingosinicellaceae bacterium]|nr:hypothetical protein KX816_05810 [Sphingosinicellaceae bacterium]